MGDVTNGLGEAANGQGKVTRGLGDATTRSGEATRVLGEATMELGEATTGPGDATRELGEATRGLGDATTGSGEATRTLGEATRELGEPTTGLGDAANELNGIKEDVQRWRDEATERRLKLVTMPLVFELDSWLNYTKWHAVLSRSKYDMLQTYDFLRFPGPEETRLRHLLRAWNLIKTRALDTLTKRLAVSCPGYRSRGLLTKPLCRQSGTRPPRQGCRIPRPEYRSAPAPLLTFPRTCLIAKAPITDPVAPGMDDAPV